MFNDDRSDFAAPIAAFLFIALASAVFVAYSICAQSGIPQSDISLLIYLGVIGFIIAGFNLYKGYLAEGFSVGLFSLLVLALFNMALSIPAAVGLCVLFAFCALVCCMTGIMDLAIIDCIAAIISITTLGVDLHASVDALVCILGFIPAVIALYVAYCDWTFAQEIIESYEDEFLGCDCEDEECDCGEHHDGCCCEECCSEDAAPAEDAAVEEQEEPSEKEE